jgi:hypothetical protein
VPVIQGISEYGYEFLIFNKWGEVIFSSQTPSAGWNGRVNNGAYYAAPGLYTYALTLTQQGSLKRDKFFGSIMLIR